MVINATIGKKLQASSVASGAASAAALSAAYATPAALASLASFGTNAVPAQAALISTVALSNVLSSVKGFEKGGAVSKDQPILVGERGAELFIPNQTGQITQSARGTGMNGANTININVSATDVRGVKELLIDNRSTIVNAVNIALNEKGKEALV
jgi:phage-related minor tail protein